MLSIAPAPSALSCAGPPKGLRLRCSLTRKEGRSLISSAIAGGQRLGFREALRVKAADPRKLLIDRGNCLNRLRAGAPATLALL
jgi:hypothetical protein